MENKGKKTRKERRDKIKREEKFEGGGSEKWRSEKKKRAWRRE